MDEFSEDLEFGAFSEEEEDTLKDQYLTYDLGEESYAIEIKYVREIVGIQDITQLPDMPRFLKGVINLRGHIIPLIDVRLRFAMEEIEYTERTCIIVVQYGDAQFGLIVDSVAEVVSIPENSIDPPPSAGRAKKDYFLKGIGKLDNEVKIIVDVERILSEDQLEELQGIG